MTLAETQEEGTQDLRKEWGEAYAWLPEKEQECLAEPYRQLHNPKEKCQVKSQRSHLNGLV